MKSSLVFLHPYTYIDDQLVFYILFWFQIADPICSIFIALMIFMSVVPLVKETSLILLLRTPESHSESLSIALRKVGIDYRIQMFAPFTRNHKLISMTVNWLFLLFWYIIVIAIGYDKLLQVYLQRFFIFFLFLYFLSLF